MKPSIKDVAKACNVSTTTVSLVLNNKPNRISEDTKSLIQKVASEMNYRPNLLSRSLVTKKLGIVGLIVPNLSINFYSEFLQELIINLETNNYNVLIGVSNFDPETEKASVLKFLDYGVDAIILSGSYTNNNQNNNESIELLAKSRTPFLIVGGYAIGSPYTTLSLNHIVSGYLATKYLLDLGHRKIGIVCEPLDIILNKLWIEGYENALAEFGLNINRDLEINTEDEDITDYILDYLISKDVTAILISGDSITYNVFERAKEIGINLPEDLSIVYLGNSYAYNYSYPRLTCVTPPTKRIAQDVNGILKELMENPKGHIDYCYRPDLIVRNSTKPLTSKVMDWLMGKRFLNKILITTKLLQILEHKLQFAIIDRIKPLSCFIDIKMLLVPFVSNLINLENKP